MRKHHRNQSKRKRRFPRRKPRGMTDAEALGITTQITQLEDEIEQSQREIIENDRHVAEAADRWRYHNLRLKYLIGQSESSSGACVSDASTHEK